MLTSKQVAERAGKLTASRVACLMTSDKVAIDRLYREMIGEEVEEDLSDVWPVQLGACTENLNLQWYENTCRNEVTRLGWVMVHPEFGQFAATLDGWDSVLHCPIECKHVGGREPREVVRDRYQPQMQWQMFVTGATQCALSIIMGANAPTIEYIPRDDEYIKELSTRAASFMLSVETRTPPVVLDEVPPPIAPGTKVYDMTGSNTWADAAARWLDSKVAAILNRECEKILKSIVPKDAGKCHGHGVQVTCDRAGRLSLREKSDAL